VLKRISHSDELIVERNLILSFGWSVSIKRFNSITALSLPFSVFSVSFVQSPSYASC